MSSSLTCAVEETDRYFGLVNLKTMYKYDGMTFGSEDIGAGRFLFGQPKFSFQQLYLLFELL